MNWEKHYTFDDIDINIITFEDAEKEFEGCDLKDFTHRAYRLNVISEELLNRLDRDDIKYDMKSIFVNDFDIKFDYIYFIQQLMKLINTFKYPNDSAFEKEIGENIEPYYDISFVDICNINNKLKNICLHLTYVNDIVEGRRGWLSGDEYKARIFFIYRALYMLKEFFKLNFES